VHLPTTNANLILSNPLLALERLSSNAASEALPAGVPRSSGSLTLRPNSLGSNTPGSADPGGTMGWAARSFSLNYGSQHSRRPGLRGSGQQQSAVPPPLPASSSSTSSCKDASVVMQELLCSLSEDPCLGQKGLAVDPVNLKPPSPAGSAGTSPELQHRINVYNRRNQEERGWGQGPGQGPGRGQGCVLLQTKPLIHLHDGGGGEEPALDEKYRLLGSADTPTGHMSDT